MSGPLKLHWARSKPNFGDWLSPLLCERLSGRRVVHATVKRCDLIAIGSLMQRVPELWWQRRLHVWGTGFIQPVAPHASRHHFHALRGSLSAGLVTNLPHGLPLGDPGLLADLLLEGRAAVPPKRLFGVIPHYKDRNAPEIERLRSEPPERVEVLDVFSDPLQLLREIAASEIILSSAMHGLVAADSLGVPNRWIPLSEDVRGGGFKFRDYYSVFGLEPDPLALEALPPPESIADPYRRPGIDAIKQGLIASFPKEL